MCRKELFRLLPIDLYFKKIYKSLSLAGYQTQSALSVGEFLVQIVRIRRKKNQLAIFLAKRSSEALSYSALIAGDQRSPQS